MAAQSIFRRALLVAILTGKYERSPMLGIPVPPGVVQVGPRVPAVQAGEQSLAIRLDTAVILGTLPSEYFLMQNSGIAKY